VAVAVTGQRRAALWRCVSGVCLPGSVHQHPHARHAILSVSAFQRVSWVIPSQQEPHHMHNNKRRTVSTMPEKSKSAYFCIARLWNSDTAPTIHIYVSQSLHPACLPVHPNDKSVRDAHALRRIRLPFCMEHQPLAATRQACQRCNLVACRAASCCEAGSRKA